MKEELRLQMKERGAPKAAEEDANNSATAAANAEAAEAATRGKRDFAGRYGEYICDTPAPLLESAVRASRHLKPDFLVWTGDTGPHIKPGAGHLPRDRLVETIRVASDIIANSTAPGLTVVPCLGDHDFSPVGLDPGPRAGSQWLLDAVADAWSRWLTPDAESSLRARGYYSLPLGGTPALRAIVLNTQECDVLNFYNMVRPGTGSNGEAQLRWLRDSLRQTEDSGESALIVGHIPPGLWNGCYGNFTERYEEVIAEFPRTVSGQVFGHRHSGAWRVLSDGQGSAGSVALTTPSLTPYKEQDPSFRVYHLNKPEEGEAAAWPAVRPRLAITAMGQFAANIAGYSDTSGGDLSWKLTFYMPGSLPFNRTSMAPAQFQRTADLMLRDLSAQIEYRYREANGRKDMVNELESQYWACALTAIRTRDLIECAHLAEENLIKFYVNMHHNYVLTNMFPFDVIYGHFCDVFFNLTGDASCEERKKALLS